MYQNFFTHSSVCGHLGCFHVLAVVNSAAMNTEVQVSFSVMVFSGYVPSGGCGLLSKIRSLKLCHVSLNIGKQVTELAINFIVVFVL